MKFISFGLLALGCFVFFNFHVNPVLLVIFIFLTLIITTLMVHFFNRYNIEKSLKFIDNYKIPDIVMQKFRKKNPKLDKAQEYHVVQALKQFFMIHALNKFKNNHKTTYAMPSKIADELWHEFMLCSRQYTEFCKQAFGQFLHHVPNEQESLTSPQNMSNFPKNLVSTYQEAKQIEKYGFCSALGMIPILFAVDSALKIEDGFYYDNKTIERIDSQLLEDIKRNQFNSSRSSCSSGTYGSDSSSSDSSSSCSSCGSGCGGGD